MKSKKVIDAILYGDNGPYISAIPVLMLATVDDMLDSFIVRLIRKFDHPKQTEVDH